MAHRKSESPRRVVYSRNQSVSPPRVPEQRAQSKSPPRLPAQRAQSQSPPRMDFYRTQSRSPPRLKEQRAESQSPPRTDFYRTQSRSPPRLKEQRAESQSPPRMDFYRTQSRSPPRLTEQRAESMSPPRLAEDRALSTSPLRTRGHHRPRDSSAAQTAGSERIQNSGRTGRKHRRATPTPSQRAAPAETDLHAACWTGNMAEVKRLLSQDQADINGDGGLWSMTPVLTAAFEGHSDVVELLVSQGADVSLEDGDGDNILHCACWGGDRKTVEYVLSLDAVDVNSRGEWSWTPVMWAAGGGHSDVVELLVSRGADLSLVTYGGDNILHWACGGGDRKTVEFVLSLDAVDVNARNNDGKTAADVARDWGHHQLSDLLVSRGTQ